MRKQDRLQSFTNTRKGKEMSDRPSELYWIDKVALKALAKACGHKEIGKKAIEWSLEAYQEARYNACNANGGMNDPGREDRIKEIHNVAYQAIVDFVKQKG